MIELRSVGMMVREDRAVFLLDLFTCGVVRSVSSYLDDGCPYYEATGDLDTRVTGMASPEDAAFKVALLVAQCSLRHSPRVRSARLILKDHGLPVPSARRRKKA